MRTTQNVLLVILFMVGLATCAFPQREANIWYFGDSAGIDFNSGSAVAITDGSLSTLEGCASISDGSTGMLLFYTDGITVYNRNHVQMTNGTGLMGDLSTTQSATILPHPGNSDLYYIFTLDNVGGPNGLRYSIVDMSLSGGFGAITAAKNVVLLASSTEKLTSACHSNGTDYWVVTHTLNSNSFYAWQISATGLNPVPVISNAGAFLNSNSPAEMKISPDGTRLAFCSWFDNINQVFNFNNANGVVYNAITLTAAGAEYGCCFSPDGTKLYYSGVDIFLRQVVQFDLSAGTPAAINASRTVLTSANVNRGQFQIGPDGKIYLARTFQPDLAVINNPNAAGLACNYVETGFNLGGKLSQMGLPNMVSCLAVVLDLEFASFSGELRPDGQVDLHWEAAEESCQGNYKVERSPDAAFFYAIGEVPFNGTGDQLTRHDFTDTQPLTGTNFYRIRYTDSNGEISISEIVTIEQNADPMAIGIQSLVTWSPNPAGDFLQLEIEVTDDLQEEWSVEFYTVEGKLVRTESLGRLTAGLYRQRFDVREMQSGFYYLQVKNGNKKAVQSVIIRH